MKTPTTEQCPACATEYTITIPPSKTMWIAFLVHTCDAGQVFLANLPKLSPGHHLSPTTHFVEVEKEQKK